jgi:hypothetical protein
VYAEEQGGWKALHDAMNSFLWGIGGQGIIQLREGWCQAAMHLQGVRQGELSLTVIGELR